MSDVTIPSDRLDELLAAEVLADQLKTELRVRTVEAYRLAEALKQAEPFLGSFAASPETEQEILRVLRNFEAKHGAAA
jgi:hypothetical protein